MQQPPTSSVPSGPSSRIKGSRSASLDLASLLERQPLQQRDRSLTTGPSTRSLLPLIGEPGNAFHDTGLRIDSQVGQSGVVDTPTILLQRSPTPESVVVASSLPNSFVSHITRTPPRSLDTAPSDGSGNSTSSRPPTPSAHNGVSNNDPAINYGVDGAVKAASLPGLVKRLLLDSKDFRKDIEFREIFLTSYRAFSNAEDVYRLLLEQFEAVSAPEHSGKQRASVRYSVLTVLEQWVRGHHVEAKDLQLLQQMREFANDLQASSVPVFRDSAQRLTELIEDSMNTFLSPVPTLTPSSSSSPSTRSSLKPSEISPQDLALALTILERDRYQKIISPDCIGWLEGLHDSNGVSSFIMENRKLSSWVQKSILKPDKQSQRAENLKYFINVIEECRRLRNFSSACALTGGLATISITGLKRTFDLDKPIRRSFEEAEKLISFEKNFKAYRAALNSSQEPCIPWLYVHLHDLKIIHRAHQPFEQDGNMELINFDRYRRVHHRIRHILSYQDPPIEPPNISHYHAEIQMLVDNQLRSLVVDDALLSWLQHRGSQLAREEKEDYDGHKQELGAAGFARPATVESRPKTPRRSHSTSRPPPSSPQDLSPTTPLAGVIPLQTIIESPKPEEVVEGPLLLNPLDRNSMRCLDGRITCLSKHAVAFGGFADVWEGLLGDQKVAIKIIRPFAGSGRRIEESKLRKRLSREYSAWSSASHPNVLGCLGFSYDFSPEPYSLPSLISPWISNGTVLSYFEKHPDTDRLTMLLGIAQGLSYLHDRQIIHGDLRAGNVLVSDSGVPYLSDFGLSRILQVEEMTTSSEPAGSLRWMSPELLLGQEVISSSSDVWAYGMTILEILSGKHPYIELKGPAAATAQIMNGQIPSRPQDTTILTNRVWAICQQCWIVMPEDRASMHDVLVKLHAITG